MKELENKISSVFLPEKQVVVNARETDTADSVRYKYDITFDGQSPRNYIAMQKMPENDDFVEREIIAPAFAKVRKRENENKLNLGSSPREDIVRDKGLSEIRVEKKEDTDYVAPVFKGAIGGAADRAWTAYSSVYHGGMDLGSWVAELKTGDEKNTNIDEEVRRSIAQSMMAKEKVMKFLNLVPDENDSKTGYELGNVLGSVLESFAIAGLTKSTSAMAAYLGLSSGGGAYEELRYGGVQPLESAAVAFGVGFTGGMLERYGLHNLVNAWSARRLRSAVFKSTAGEFIQEASQTGAEEFLMAPYREGYQPEILKEMATAGVYGAIGGLFGFGLGRAMNTRARNYYKSLLQKDYNMSPEKADELVEAVFIDNEQAKKELKELIDNETIATLENDNAVNDAEQTLKEGQDILDKLLAQKAMGLSDEVQAKADEFAETMKQQALSAGESEDVADTIGKIPMVLTHNIATAAVEEGLASDVDKAVADLLAGIVGGGNKAVDENLQEVSPDIFALTDPGYDVVDEYMTPEQRQNEIDEERIATMVEDGGMSVEEATFRVKTGREPTELDKALGYDFIQYQIGERIRKIDAERLAFERKDINPDLIGRESEIKEAVDINRFFADRKASKEIGIDEVMAAVDANVGQNENGVRVLKNSITGETVTLSNSAISKMFSSTSNRLDSQNIGGILGKEAIANIGSIFNTAVLIKTTPDAKHGTKNRIRRYANVIRSDGENFIVKMTVKEMANKRPELTDIEIEDNGGRDLSAYDMKVGRKNTAEGNISGDKSPTFLNGNDISINDLIDFVNSYSEDSIQIDGKNKAARNSAGRRIVRTEEGLRAFYEWFGDSKVVDENGQPLKMVHFSGNEFSQFDKNRTGINNDESAVGFWFADKDDFAFNNEYHPVRYDVYLKMDNPLIIEGKGTETNPWADTDIDNLDPYTKFEKMFNDLMYQDPQMWDERVSESLYGGFETQKIKLHFANLSEGRKREVIKSIVDKLKTQGYDGIIIKNTQFDSVNPDERINQYVVFEPNQIKSVDNRGSFSRTDDNIYYQMSYFDDLGFSKSVRDIKTFLSGLKPKEEVRLMFDKKKRYWFAIDANDYIHNDMITKAYKQGLYPEFNSEYDARQYFDENYMADDEYLIRFKATKYGSENELQSILQEQLNQDEYTTAYSINTDGNSGYIIFARGDYDLKDTPLKGLENIADRWGRNPNKMNEVIQTNDNTVYQTGEPGEGEPNLETEAVQRTAAGQSRQNRMIYRVMGQYEPAKKLITLFQGKDTTTLCHELLHHYLPIYLHVLEKAGRFDKLEGLYRELGVSRMADMGREEWEKLVDLGTSYIFYNQAPNEASKSIFERAKQWMMDAYNTVKKFVKPSPEVTKFFDGLFARDASTLPDVSDLKGRTAELAKILQGAKNGQELTVNGLSLRDISRLRQALYARVPAAGKTLADEIRSAGGIDTESELARQLGYDSRKGTEGGFWNYKGTIKDESQLIDFLKANGYLEETTENTYEETSSVWDKVQQLINRRNNTYNEKEQSRQMARDSALAAGQVVSEILNQHYIGDVKKLEEDLRAATKMLADRGAAAVDKATLDYLTFSLKQMEKDYQCLLYQKKEERYNYQEKLTKFIKDLPLDYNHKSKFMDKIRMVKDEKSFNKYLKETKERAEKYIEQEQRRMLSNLIQSEVKSSRPRKVMAQKYDYENNVLFKDLRDYNKMTQSEAAAKLEKLDKDEESVDNPGSRGYLLRRMFLEYKANGMDSSSELMRQLYEMIGEAKQLGRESKEESEFEKSFEREQDRQQIIDKLDASKADKNKWTTMATNVYRRGITNLYSMLNSIAGKEIADKYEMETVIDRKEQREWKHLKKTSAKAEVIYKVKSYGDLLNVMADKGQEVAVLYRRQKDDTQEAQTESYNENFKYDVSVLDIIDIYNAIKNKKTREDYEKAYGADQINRLISLLSPEDRAFGDMLMEDVNSRFSELNKVYVRTYGMDLKKVDNYWMGSAEHIKPVDIVNDFRQQSTTPGFFKERTAGTVTPVAKNAWIKYQKHISQSYYMTDVAEKYKQLADIFKSTEIQNLIENHYGSGVYNALTKQIENIGLNAQSPRLDDVSGYFQKLLNNWVGAKVSVNPVVFVGQLTSFTNYAEGVNLSAFIKNIGYALAHPIEVKDFMMKYNGDFLQHRYEAGFNEAMSRFIEGAKETNGKKFGLSAKAKFNYSNALSSFVRIGDLGAIIYGGYGQFKTLLDSGMSVEEARRKFEFSTLRSQQSGNAASISDWQQQRGFPRTYLAFKNASLQYTRKIADTVIMLQNGDISREEAAKVLTNYLLIQPAFWVIAKNIAKSLLGLGDDDDEFDDGVLEQLLVNPIDGVPFVSDIVRYAYREAAGEKNYSLFSTPLLDDVEKSFRKIGKEDKDFYDFADIVTPFIEMLTSAPAGTAKRYMKIYNEKWGE